jgi:hypothetical protein
MRSRQPAALLLQLLGELQAWELLEAGAAPAGRPACRGVVSCAVLLVASTAAAVLLLLPRLLLLTSGASAPDPQPWVTQV